MLGDKANCVSTTVSAELHFSVLDFSLEESMQSWHTGFSCIIKDLAHFLLKLLHKLTNNKDYKRMARLLLGETSIMDYIALLFVDICMHIPICLCRYIHKHTRIYTHKNVYACIYYVYWFYICKWNTSWNNTYLSVLVCSVKLEIEDDDTDINCILWC